MDIRVPKHYPQILQLLNTTWRWFLSTTCKFGSWNFGVVKTSFEVNHARNTQLNLSLVLRGASWGHLGIRFAPSIRRFQDSVNHKSRGMAFALHFDCFYPKYILKESNIYKAIYPARGKLWCKEMNHVSILKSLKHLFNYNFYRKYSSVKRCLEPSIHEQDTYRVIRITRFL